MLDDDPAKLYTAPYGPQVIGGLAYAAQLREVRFVNALGSPSYYWRIPSILERINVNLDLFETIIHPSTSVSRRATIGAGTLIFAQTTISANARVGTMAQLLAGAVVSHDVVIGDYTIVAAGASIAGGVRVGRACYLGSGCVIRQGVFIGDGALVGMGAVVLQDVDPGAVVVGNPARLLRRRE